MEAKVPQRIDMEDKIVGPLTLQQFFYVLFGGMTIYLLNSWTAGTIFRFLFYPISFFIALLAVALAFVKVQDRPFIYFLGSLLTFLKRPRQRVWLRGSHASQVKIVEPKQQAAPAVHKAYDQQRVAELAKVLDSIKESNGQKQ